MWQVWNFIFGRFYTQKKKKSTENLIDRSMSDACSEFSINRWLCASLESSYKFDIQLSFCTGTWDAMTITSQLSSQWWCIFLCLFKRTSNNWQVSHFKLTSCVIEFHFKSFEFLELFDSPALIWSRLHTSLFNSHKA